jgi:hypothetical protein
VCIFLARARTTDPGAREIVNRRVRSDKKTRKKKKKKKAR